jgi:hypothetical protein
MHGKAPIDRPPTPLLNNGSTSRLNGNERKLKAFPKKIFLKDCFVTERGLHYFTITSKLHKYFRAPREDSSFWLKSQGMHKTITSVNVKSSSQFLKFCDLL